MRLGGSVIRMGIGVLLVCLIAIPGPALADAEVGASGSCDGGDRGGEGGMRVGTATHDLGDREEIQGAVEGILLFPHYPRTCGEDGEHDDYFEAHADTGVDHLGHYQSVQYCYNAVSRDSPLYGVNTPSHHEDDGHSCEWEADGNHSTE